jgi:taurine dioxygenase
MSKETAAQVTVHPVDGRIGAEIRGVHLSGDIDKKQIAAIRQALNDHKVIFFRGQQHLDDAEHEAFAELLGTPAAHPTLATAKGTSYILELDAAHGGRASSWHTDVTFVDAYPFASILRAVEVPSSGGDTLWANTVSAYRDLPSELRDLADRLWAVHSNEYDYAARRPAASEEESKRYRDTFTSTLYETGLLYTIIRKPASARCCCHFVKRIVGLSSADSAHLFSLLQSHVIAPENTVRWRWAAGDVAI